MFRVLVVLLCLVNFLKANHCTDRIKIENRFKKCPLENLTDWLDTEITILKKPPARLTADESSDRFYFIDITAVPLLDSDPVETEVCVAFSAVDFLSSESIDFEFSSRNDASLRYQMNHNLKLKNPERIREILKDPPIFNLKCYRISNLFTEETNEIDPTIQLKVKSTKNHNRRLNKYSEFYFKLPDWHKTTSKDDNGGKCQSEPFIYVNSTYRNFEKVVLKWFHCSSLIDLKISKHEENTNKQIWVEHLVDVDMRTPLVFWQIKGNNNLSRFYYKAEVITHSENSIPIWDDVKKNR